jgi:predicted transcriptional regulator
VTQRTLALKKDFSVVRLTQADAQGQTDHLKHFRELILQNEPMYPGIRRWLQHKVLPGLKTSERVAFVAYQDEVPVVSAVVKRGERSKFCHLRIADGVQDQHFGELFFSLMALEVRGFAREIHFTLPEKLWEQRQGFFRSFGFTSQIEAGTQYRLFETEFRCSAPFAAVWQAALQKMPKLMSSFSAGGYAMDTDMLMSIKPEWSESIFQGKKRVEIRRSFSTRWVDRRVSLYATTPVKGLVGEARIEDIVRGSPQEIWSSFSQEIGCTWSQFSQYTQGASQVFAVVLADAKPYSRIVPLEEMRRLTGEHLRPPQSYAALNGSKGWGKAVSLAALFNSNATGG